SVQVMKTEGSTTTHVKSCEYKGRPQEAGAEPAPQGEVSLPAESPQLA
nr:kininogen fragment,low MW [Bos taurus]